MKFCSQCGDSVIERVPDGDNRQRFVCASCNTIHYQNPRIVAGCLPVWDEQVLLCRRAIEPRRGYWTLPAGFMENGETVQQAAARETLEEACARVTDLQLYTLFDLPHINQVYILFRARLLDLDYSAGAETLEVSLVSEDEVPWDRLAFATVRNTLRHYYSDRAQGEFRFHIGTIEPVKPR